MVLTLSVAWAPADAVPVPASVTIDNLEPKLGQEDDGSWTAKLGFTNLTSELITLTAAAVVPKTGCEPELDKPTIGAASHKDVELTLPAGCKADDARVTFVVSAQPPATEKFQISSKAADKSTPDWNQLFVFPLALVLAFGWAWRTWSQWEPPVPETASSTPALVPAASSAEPAPTPVSKPSWWGPLKYLDAAYDFKESLVSNVTAIGALLTGVFGSTSAIEAAFGEDASQQIGLATFGAAIALAFIAAGAIIPLGFKAADANSFTVIGILLGAGVTLAGAAGQLWVVAWTGYELGLGDVGTVLLFVAAGLGVVLLMAYGRTALKATLNQGIVPPKVQPSEAMAAASLIAEVLRAKEDVDTDLADDAFVRLSELYPAFGTSPGDDPLPRRRAAML